MKPLHTTLKRVRNCWQLYVLLALPLVYLIIFAYGPMAGLQIAFKNFSSRLGIWGSPWVGLDNFAKFFNSYQFTRVLGNTLAVSVYYLCANFPLPILLALLLNTIEHPRYKKTVQTITYIPHFISVVVLVGMMSQIFNPINGLYGHIYRLFTGMNEAPNIMGAANTFRHMYVWSGIWQHLGWGTIIYMAALSSVDQEMHEAAKIDGASRAQRVRYIDFPCILPTAVIILILDVGKVMSIGFEKAYLMQTQLNLNQSEIIATYVYKVGLTTGNADFAYATAIGLFNSLINMVLILAVNQISKKLGDTSLW